MAGQCKRLQKARLSGRLTVGVDSGARILGLEKLEIIQMPSVKLTVKITGLNGEQVVGSAQSPAVSLEPAEASIAPYRFDDGTAPEQPTLISSSSFVTIG